MKNGALPPLPVGGPEWGDWILQCMPISNPPHCRNQGPIPTPYPSRGCDGLGEVDLAHTESGQLGDNLGVQAVGMLKGYSSKLHFHYISALVSL